MKPSAILFAYKIPAWNGSVGEKNENCTKDGIERQPKMDTAANK